MLSPVRASQRTRVASAKAAASKSIVPTKPRPCRAPAVTPLTPNTSPDGIGSAPRFQKHAVVASDVAPEPSDSEDSDDELLYYPTDSETPYAYAKSTADTDPESEDDLDVNPAQGNIESSSMSLNRQPLVPAQSIRGTNHHAGATAGSKRSRTYATEDRDEDRREHASKKIGYGVHRPIAHSTPRPAPRLNSPEPSPQSKKGKPNRNQLSYWTKSSNPMHRRLINSSLCRTSLVYLKECPWPDSQTKGKIIYNALDAASQQLTCVIQPGMAEALYKMDSARRGRLVKAVESYLHLYDIDVNITKQNSQKFPEAVESNKAAYNKAMLKGNFRFQQFDVRNGIIDRKLPWEHEVLFHVADYLGSSIFGLSADISVAEWEATFCPMPDIAIAFITAATQSAINNFSNGYRDCVPFDRNRWDQVTQQHLAQIKSWKSREGNNAVWLELAGHYGKRFIPTSITEQQSSGDDGEDASFLFEDD